MSFSSANFVGHRSANMRPGMNAIDPYWNNVGFLLNCQYLGNSTSIVDSGPLGIAVNPDPIGNPTVTPLEYVTGWPAGYGSLNNSAVMNGITYSNSFDSFTTEVWFKANYPPANPFPVSTYIYSSSSIDIIVNADQVPGRIHVVLTMLELVSQNYTTINLVYTTFAANTWTHVAIVKSGGKFYKLYVDGVLVDTVTLLPTALLPSEDSLFLGGVVDLNPLFGRNTYFGGVRQTYGVARYTSNFTRPAAPFPVGP